MPDAVLLFVFATHTPFFVWRYRTTREHRFAATAVTFSLLTAAYALRMFAPEARAFGVEIATPIRWLAGGAAAISLSLLARALLGSRRNESRSEPGETRGSV